MKLLHWAIINKHGSLYAASNAETVRAAKERHYADTGLIWAAAYDRGDRLVRISVSLIRISTLSV